MSSRVLVDYLSVWYGLPYCHNAGPASASGSSLVCSSVGTSSIWAAVGISGRFERYLSK